MQINNEFANMTRELAKKNQQLTFLNERLEQEISKRTRIEAERESFIIKRS